MIYTKKQKPMSINKYFKKYKEIEDKYLKERNELNETYALSRKKFKVLQKIRNINTKEIGEIIGYRESETMFERTFIDSMPQMVYKCRKLSPRGKKIKRKAHFFINEDRAELVE